MDKTELIMIDGLFYVKNAESSDNPMMKFRVKFKEELYKILQLNIDENWNELKDFLEELIKTEPAHKDYWNQRLTEMYSYKATIELIKKKDAEWRKKYPESKPWVSPFDHLKTKTKD